VKLFIALQNNKIFNNQKTGAKYNPIMSAEIQNNTTMNMPYHWASGKAGDETDPTGVYSPLKDLIGKNKPSPLRVAFLVENGQSYFQTNTATELNETEKKLQSILYNHLPEETKSWLKQQRQV
jgi:hypothetical protein